MAVETANVVTLALSLAQGETIVSPMPEPTSIKTSVKAEAATAPAMTGPQLTADEDDSTVAAVVVAEYVSAMDFLLTEQRESVSWRAQDRRRAGGFTAREFRA
jgi:hypothetical protein